MTMTQTTILFDVGGVIVRPLDPEAARERRAALAQSLGFASGDEMWLHFYTSEEWELAKTGRMEGAEMWDRLLRPYGIVEREAQEQFVSELHYGEGIHPEMEILIAGLHGRYRLGILSNWDDGLETILEEKLGISHYFYAIMNSHRIGAAKPDEEAFRIALKRLEARPAEVFFIDDQERNTVAAGELGMDAHTFQDMQGLKEALRKRSLLDGREVSEDAPSASPDARSVS